MTKISNVTFISIFLVNNKRYFQMVLWQEEISFILFYVHCKSCTIKEFLFYRTDEDRALSEFSPAAALRLIIIDQSAPTITG